MTVKTQDVYIPDAPKPEGVAEPETSPAEADEASE
jgi:hypothetical protein